MKLSDLLRILQDTYDIEGDMEVEVQVRHMTKKGNMRIVTSEPNLVYVEGTGANDDTLIISDSPMEDILYFDKHGNPKRVSGDKRRYYM